MNKILFHSKDELYDLLSTPNFQKSDILDCEVKHRYLTEKIKINRLAKEDKIVTLNAKTASGKLLDSNKSLLTWFGAKKSPSQTDGTSVLESWLINHKLWRNNDANDIYLLNIKWRRNLNWSCSSWIKNMEHEFNQGFIHCDFQINYSYSHEEIMSKIFLFQPFKFLS